MKGEGSHNCSSPVAMASFLFACFFQGNNISFLFSFVQRNCHHCGKVFCENCTTKSVLGNNSNRPHPVCDNCFAILSKDSKSTFYNTSLADDQR